MSDLVTYYCYAPDGLFLGSVQRTIFEAQPASSTLDAPLGAEPGQLYRRVGSTWSIEALVQDTSTNA